MPHSRCLPVNRLLSHVYLRYSLSIVHFHIQHFIMTTTAFDSPVNISRSSVSQPAFDAISTRTQANIQNSCSLLRHIAEHETAASQLFNQPPHHQPTARRFSEKQNTVLCLLCVCKLRSELNVVVVVC